MTKISSTQVEHRRQQDELVGKVLGGICAVDDLAQQHRLLEELGVEAEVLALENAEDVLELLRTHLLFQPSKLTARDVLFARQLHVNVQNLEEVVVVLALDVRNGVQLALAQQVLLDLPDAGLQLRHKAYIVVFRPLLRLALDLQHLLQVLHQNRRELRVVQIQHDLSVHELRHFTRNFAEFVQDFLKLKSERFSPAECR